MILKVILSLFFIVCLIYLAIQGYLDIKEILKDIKNKTSK